MIAVTGVNVAAELLTEMLKVTVWLETGLLLASRTAAVSVAVAPLARVVEPNKVIVVALPAVNTTLAVATKPLALARIVAVPRLFELVKVTCANPVLSVIADGSDSVPALVEKFTVMPDATAPLMSVTRARTTVLVPPAGIEAAPVLSTRLLTTVAPALEVILTVPVLALLVVAVIVSIPAVAPAV